jgi:predicted PurR-regulated permease PerM
LLPILLMLVVAALLAVALDPLVGWLERRGLSRGSATMVVAGVLLLAIGGFLWFTWSSLVSQWQQLAGEVGDTFGRLRDRLPAWITADAEGAGDAGASGQGSSRLETLLVGLARSMVSAATLMVLGFVLTVYLLIDGRRTWQWLLAFVPPRHRSRVERTAAESRKVIVAYAVGNAITSAIAFGCTLAVLLVPAALLLALIAGLSDFVPVLGFIASAIPAVILSLSVSATTALIVIAFYVIYNAVESYLIAPWAYGNRMKLSDVAVILGFAAGAQLGGVIGALIALPLVALYPTVERIWLRDQLPPDTASKHAAIEGGRRHKAIS